MSKSARSWGGAAMSVLVGTSGFAYKAWKGTFYPKGIKAEGMLRGVASSCSA